ncbi:Box C/D snoRNA protein 1 [Mycena sanguinolenta]|uniref:Box C/D snoRNA protein 1 n=1 Tax=Mycena sanguinolenta TaxID=230812 RepID=A0A8H6YBK2_9AGAR|nr:Box C/D snoRNA protein 1 [Mycena sanguinolenta]
MAPSLQYFFSRMATMTAESSSTVAAVSSGTRVLCSICNHRYAIYTCPRCATRTCSLPCSSTHKTRTACSGQRDKAAYVPMNRYGWGTMMDDYVFLEDVGRKVADWGSEIAKGKFQAGATTAGDRGGRGRGRGRGRMHGSGNGWTKRDVLKMQLETRDIEMNILPPGMERRKLNQSTWDAKTQTALLTIEFKFHPTPNPLAPPSQPPDAPHTLLTHRNSIDTPLLTLLQTHVGERKEGAKGAAPAWVRALVSPDLSPESEPIDWPPPQCVMSAPAALNPLSARQRQKRPQSPYYRLDYTKSLAEVLKYTQFVEFPTIEVWEEFRGTVVDAAGCGHTGTARRRGRTRAEAAETGPERRREKDCGVVGWMLGGYEGSDEEAEGDEQMPIQRGELEDSDEDEQIELDPAALLELVRKARGDENWMPQMGDDDLVDWGESDHEM